MSDEPTYAIAEAAARTGFSADTLRYYEKIGLIDRARRDSGGRRAFTEDDLAMLRFLLKLRLTGMPIQLMQTYVELRRRGPATSGARRELLVTHREAVAARIAELRSCLDVLDSKIANYEEIERCLPCTDLVDEPQEALA